MKKILFSIFVFLCFFLPLNVNALSKDYIDKVAPITHTETEENKISLYLFHGQECPHCEEERNWLETIKEKYKDYLNVYYFEVWHNETNSTYLGEVKQAFYINRSGVPLTIVGDSYYIGYSSTTASLIENKIEEYIGEEKPKEEDKEIVIPFIGKVKIKDVSIPLVAVILGFVDGFNPCAMWILLFLINLLLGVENKKKAWFLGFTFLSVSGLVYFLSMIGINFVLNITAVNWIKIALGVFILGAGIYNFQKYLKQRKEEAGCTVVDDKKRKKLIKQMKNITESKGFLFSILGIAALAVSVNLVELACSLGFPLIFTEILSINQIHGVTKLLYLLLYILFYMIDDIVVFTISMVTVEATGITNKYNKLCTLVSSIIMVLMGLLLLFKPEWLMLNF